MNTESVSCEVVSKILLELNDRSGFDGWWSNIDYDIQEEIENELVSIIKSILDKSN
jgi:hypothetical protein